MFLQLVLYRTRNGGSCDVPKGYLVEAGGERSAVDGSLCLGKERARVNLGGWVHEMRRYRRTLVRQGANNPSPSRQPDEKLVEAASVLTPDRIEALDGLGFAWEVARMNPRSFRHDLWQERYDKLVEFHAEHGHCDVPKEHGLLHRWCNNQRDLNAEVMGTKVDMGPTARKCAGWAEEVSVERKRRIRGMQTPEYKEVWLKRKVTRYCMYGRPGFLSSFLLRTFFPH